MRTTILTRLYALAMSVLFASMATVGVAALMASSGEQAKMELDAGARQSAPPATPALGLRPTPAPGATQVSFRPGGHEPGESHCSPV